MCVLVAGGREHGVPLRVRKRPEMPRPCTRNPRPEIRNPKPQTRNPKPETRVPKPGICWGCTDEKGGRYAFRKAILVLIFHFGAVRVYSGLLEYTSRRIWHGREHSVRRCVSLQNCKVVLDYVDMVLHGALDDVIYCLYITY